jgi:V-type H+-transporting ATPase subunit a
MKLSVFLGVIQMVFGIILKGVNAGYHHSVIELLCEFLPQLIFMLALFGYMDVMIVIKWVTDWTFVQQDAPALITELINIPLKGGDPGPVPLYSTISGQTAVHNAILCIN